jgi:hypothetical protein
MALRAIVLSADSCYTVEGCGPRMFTSNVQHSASRKWRPSLPGANRVLSLLTREFVVHQRVAMRSWTHKASALGDAALLLELSKEHHCEGASSSLRSRRSGSCGSQSEASLNDVAALAGKGPLA